MTSSCRLPSSLLAAGMPLEFRLTLDLIPTDYEHLHQTVTFRSINSVPRLSLGFSFLTLYPRFWTRLYVRLYVKLPFIAAPTWEMGDSLIMVNPPDASYAYVFSQLWETVAPNALQTETSETSQQTVRTAVSPARVVQRGAFLDHSQYDLFYASTRWTTTRPRPSQPLCQYRLTYQVLRRLSASGHECPLCVG